MKNLFSFIPCLLLSTSAGIVTASRVMAVPQCVVTDVGVQIAVHGSGRPAEQINEVDVQSSEPCSGNTSTSVGTQVHVGGTGEVRQERRSSHRIQGRRSQGNGREGQTMSIPVDVRINVDNPADRLRL
jgi:hypothetical protein